MDAYQSQSRSATTRLNFMNAARTLPESLNDFDYYTDSSYDIRPSNLPPSYLTYPSVDGNGTIIPQGKFLCDCGTLLSIKSWMNGSRSHFDTANHVQHGGPPPKKAIAKNREVNVRFCKNCGKLFSRSDALIRHLEQSMTSCRLKDGLSADHRIHFNTPGTRMIDQTSEMHIVDAEGCQCPATGPSPNNPVSGNTRSNEFDSPLSGQSQPMAATFCWLQAAPAPALVLDPQDLGLDYSSFIYSPPGLALVPQEACSVDPTIRFPGYANIVYNDGAQPTLLSQRHEPQDSYLQSALSGISTLSLSPEYMNHPAHEGFSNDTDTSRTSIATELEECMLYDGDGNWMGNTPGWDDSFDYSIFFPSATLNSLQ